MRSIETLTLGAYQTNCYLVWAEGSKTCAVIDPGYDPQTVLAKAAALGLEIDAILLTHGHFDHVGGAAELVGAAGCPLWIQKGDRSLPDTPLARQLFPLPSGIDCKFYQEGDTVTAGGLEFTVLETPGHTRGSVCLLCGDTLFSGDTLFAGSCGRTDLPGGSPEAMRRSLARLAKLEGDFTVFPGHGERSTLERERRGNFYLRGSL